METCCAVLTTSVTLQYCLITLILSFKQSQQASSYFLKSRWIQYSKCDQKSNRARDLNPNIAANPV